MFQIFTEPNYSFKISLNQFSKCEFLKRLKIFKKSNTLHIESFETYQLLYDIFIKDVIASEDDYRYLGFHTPYGFDLYENNFELISLDSIEYKINYSPEWNQKNNIIPSKNTEIKSN